MLFIQCLCSLCDEKDVVDAVMMVPMVIGLYVREDLGVNFFEKIKEDLLKKAGFSTLYKTTFDEALEHLNAYQPAAVPKSVSTSEAASPMTARNKAAQLRGK